MPSRTPKTHDPSPLERYELSHPAVPEDLDGLTILQITDGHVRTPQERDPAFKRLLNAIASVEVDLIALTGDYMTEPGDEPAALDAIERMREVWRARHGVYGVFGNHDSHELKAAARRLEGITWLENRVEDLSPRLPLRLIGISYPEDLFGAVLEEEGTEGGGEGTKAQRHEGTEGGEEGTEARRHEGTKGGEDGTEVRRGRDGRDAESDPALRASVPPCLRASPLPFLISHYPTEIFPAAELGIPLMIAGHTHGGQIRLIKGHVPHTSSDFPSHVATGMIRLRNTVCAVSRGVGEAYVGVRINCPRQLPMYTLRRGPALVDRHKKDGEYLTLTQVLAW